MLMPLLPSHTLQRLSRCNSRLKSIQPVTAPCRSKASPSSSLSNNGFGTLRVRRASSASRSRIIVATTGLASALSSTVATTTLALCDSNKNDNTDDEDFISKIRSKLDSQSIPGDLFSNNETITAIATTIGSQISLAISSGIPTDISYGFFAGYFTGLALKKIGKVASITLGATFLGLQTLAYHGYIDVHHDKLRKQVEEVLDRNNDGVVDGQDIKSILEDVQKVAGFGLSEEDEDGTKSLMASGGGFGLGFWGGLRSG